MPRKNRRPVIQPVSDREALAALTPREQAQRARAFEALDIARKKKVSRKTAAEEARVTVAELMRYTGHAWKRKGDRWVPKAYDLGYRGTMNLLTPSGVVTLEISDSRQADLIKEHRQRVRWAYHTGNYRELHRRFRGKRIKVGGVTYQFATDPQLIRAFGARAELDYEAYDDAA